ncbi:MAG: hypothetical protein MH321_14235, partial [Leptospiraceae bacterium]|nr:hypothetical protein [Leptospiraceae bacterium]
CSPYLIVEEDLHNYLDTSVVDEVKHPRLLAKRFLLRGFFWNEEPKSILLRPWGKGFTLGSNL